jgi:hypothetical protein
MKSRTRFAALALAVGVNASASAQAAMDKPMYAIGDKWEFARVSSDGTKNTWTREIVEMPAAGRLRVKFGNGTVSDYDDAMNPMPEGDPERTYRLVVYPLKRTTEWSLSRRFPDPNVGETGTGRVTSMERVTVPAGTFECYRTEIASSRTNKQLKTNTQWVRWYCPEVKWLAKQIVETYTYNPYNPAATGTVVETSELVKFTPGK